MSSVRAEDHFDRLYAPDFPEIGTGPVSIEPYVSPEYFELERERIFRNAWMLVCHETEIPNPGDYVVKDIAVLGASIIVVRGTDGAVRALHNVCKHRGNKLVYAPGHGSAKAFVCRFHGWAYALDGRLRGVPEQDRFVDLDKKKCGLPGMTADTWRGFVFVHAKAQPQQTLREYLGSLAVALEPYPFERMRMVAQWTAKLRANWKVVLNAFQEAYHVATVHTTVAPSLFAGTKSPATRIFAFRLQGRHRSMTVAKNPDFRPSPTEALAGEFSTGLSQQVAAQMQLEPWPGTNPANHPSFAFDINVVFPINCIDTGPGYYFTYEFWPVSVNETSWITKLYFGEPRTWRERIGQEFTIVQMREGLLEDLTTLEATQQGLESGALEHLVLSDQEIAIRHHHEVVESIVRG